MSSEDEGPSASRSPRCGHATRPRGPAPSPAVRAAAANEARYATGERVTHYQAEPYHRLRLELAADLLAAYCRRPGAAAPPLVADLGAGTGAVAALLSDRGMTTVLCDVDHRSLRAARDAAPGTPAVQLDAAEHLPFASNALDGVFAGELIEHLFDPGWLLRECHRVLRPGGVLVLTTPNLATFQDRLRFLAGHSPRQVDPYHEYLRLHIRPFSYRSLALALRTEGFAPVGLRSNHVRWHTATKAHGSRLLARLFPSLGGSLVVGALRV